MRRGLCGSVSPSGRFPDFCAVARPPAGECSEFSHALLSFMPARTQAEHPREWQGHGACLFPLQICRLMLTPSAENALSALS